MSDPLPIPIFTKYILDNHVGEYGSHLLAPLNEFPIVMFPYITIGKPFNCNDCHPYVSEGRGQQAGNVDDLHLTK